MAEEAIGVSREMRMSLSPHRWLTMILVLLGLCTATAVLAQAPDAVADADPGGNPMQREPIETDPDSGAQIYLLSEEGRPADNIYGEQPYSDPSGRRIAVRYYSTEERPGGLSFVDLYDGSTHEVLSGKPPFPAFHAWGEWLYYHRVVDGQRLLRRSNFLTYVTEDIAVLPDDRGSYSYGTVSPDHHYYAVAVSPPEGGPSQVHMLDLQTGAWSVLLAMEGYHAKHEQFSRDGRNRVLIQLNQMPDVAQVLLGEITVEGEMTLFPADRPHTARPTGHEAWVGDTDRIFFSTGRDAEVSGNIWTARVGDEGPRLISTGEQRFGHVSVSACGRYWVGDTGEEGVPIYIGSFETGGWARAAFSRTVYDGKQWAHAHPYLTADNRWLIFTARRGELPAVYGARLPEGWLEAL